VHTACLKENNPQDEPSTIVTSEISYRAEIWGALGAVHMKLVSEKGCFTCSAAPDTGFEKTSLKKKKKSLSTAL